MRSSSKLGQVEAVAEGGAEPARKSAGSSGADEQRPDPLGLPVRPEDVRSAYRWIFGREVESEEAVAAHLAEETRGDLRMLLLSSEEFLNTYSAGLARADHGAATGGGAPAGDLAAGDVQDAALWLLGAPTQDPRLVAEPAPAQSRKDLRRLVLGTEAFRQVYRAIRESRIADDPLLSPPGPDDVRNAFLWVLGREVESEAAVEAHLALRDRRQLRQALMSSQEFADAYATESAGTGSRWVAAEVLDGRLVWLDLYDRFVSRGVLKETWKQAETHLVRSILKPGDGFIDAGANIGWFTVVTAALVGRFGQVHAFEPADHVRSYLEKTVAMNRLSAQVAVSPFALWDQNTTGVLAEKPELYNPGHAWIEAESSSTEGAPVECRRLDDVVDLPKLTVLKMALEGAEFRALRGAEQTLRSHSPIVLAELNVPMLNQVSSASARDFHEFMATQGYNCRLVAPDGYDGAGQPETRAASAGDLEALGPDAIKTLLFTR